MDRSGESCPARNYVTFILATLGFLHESGTSVANTSALLLYRSMTSLCSPRHPSWMHFVLPPRQTNKRSRLLSPRTGISQLPIDTSISRSTYPWNSCVRSPPSYPLLRNRSRPTTISHPTTTTTTSMMTMLSCSFVTTTMSCTMCWLLYLNRRLLLEIAIIIIA